MDEIKNKIDWHEELLKCGFRSLESTTRTYGNEKFTGSVVDENWDGKFFTISEKKGKNTKEVFCPFIHDESEKSMNVSKGEYQSIRLRNIEDLKNYIHASVVEQADTLDSKPNG